MITLLVVFVLAVLTGLFWVGYHVTGAILKTIFWLCIRLPITIVLWALGLVFCCTLILIPVGLGLFRAGLGVLIPG